MQTKWKLHWGTPVVAAFLCMQGEILTLLMGVTALALHELCHILVAKRLGFLVERITILPFGAAMELCTVGQSGLWLVYLCGPMSNAIAAMCILACMQLFPGIGSYAEPFLMANGLLVLLNLLPIYPLDGARLLEEVLNRIFTGRTTVCLLMGTTVLFAVGLIALCLYGILLGVPCYLPFIMVLYVGTVGIRRLLFGQENTVGAAVGRRARLRRGEAVRVRLLVANADMTVGEALRGMGGDSFTVLRVLDEQNRRIGEVDEGMLLTAASRSGANTTLKEILLGIDLP